MFSLGDVTEGTPDFIRGEERVGMATSDAFAFKGFAGDDSDFFLGEERVETCFFLGDFGNGMSRFLTGDDRSKGAFTIEEIDGMETARFLLRAGDRLEDDFLVSDLDLR